MIAAPAPRAAHTCCRLPPTWVKEWAHEDGAAATTEFYCCPSQRPVAMTRQPAACSSLSHAVLRDWTGLPRSRTADIQSGTCLLLFPDRCAAPSNRIACVADCMSPVPNCKRAVRNCIVRVAVPQGSSSELHRCGPEPQWKSPFLIEYGPELHRWCTAAEAAGAEPRRRPDARRQRGSKTHPPGRLDARPGRRPGHSCTPRRRPATVRRNRRNLCYSWRIHSG